MFFMEGNHGKAHIMLETFCAQNLKTLIDTQIFFVRRHNSRNNSQSITNTISLNFITCFSLFKIS